MKAVPCCILCLFLLTSGRALAQADEPGLGGPPTDPSPPPSPAPAPPSDHTEPAPTPAPAPGEPGEPGQPGAPGQPTDNDLRTLARARQVCVSGAACPMLPDLFRLLSSPRAAVGAADVLGGTRDRRAVMPLAQAAAYGSTRALRAAAQQALRRLAATASVKTYMGRAAKLDPDPRTKAALSAAVMGVGVGATRTPAGAGDVGPGARAASPHSANPIAGQRTKYAFPDPESPRVIYGQTAFLRKKGMWDWTITQLGLWSFDYGVTDWMSVGVEAAPPIVFFTMFPHIKIGTQLGKNVSVAVRAMGGLAYPYIADIDGHFGIIGGGPILTIGDADMCFNISWPVYATFVVEHDKVRYDFTTGIYSGPEDEYENGWLTLPHIGFSVRLHKRVKLNLELYSVNAQGFEYNGKFWLLMYGIRIMGERIFGDINFVMPLFEDSDEVLQYMPIGYPLLQFGFQW